MVARSRSTLFGSCLLALHSMAKAAPADSAQQLGKREATLKGSSTLSINGKVPVDLIILIGVALLFALLCFFVALFNVYMPNASGTKVVREERARAKTELRLKGAGGALSPTPRNIAEKKRSRYSNVDTNSIETPSDLSPNPLYNAPRKHPLGPRLAPNASNARATRASRGYSSYSKYDISSLSKSPGMSQASPGSLLTVPALPATYSDNYSSPSLSSAGSLGTPPIPGGHPWHARPAHDRSRTMSNQHMTRTSTTIGRGTDLNRNRHSKDFNSNIYINPQAVDPSYPNQRRLSPQGSMSDLSGDPLSGYELKRYTTDPSDSLEGSRRNSTMNALDFFSTSGSGLSSNRTFTESGSESPIYDPYSAQQPLTSRASPTRSGASSLTRSRPLAFYDLEQDIPGSHADSALLDSRSSEASPSKQSPRKVWGRF